MALQPYNDPYTRIKQLGKGSFGRIILVRDERDGKEYVLKEIDLDQFGPKGRKEAMKEVSFLLQFHHPYIIAYKEFFEKSLPRLPSHTQHDMKEKQENKKLAEHSNTVGEQNQKKMLFIVMEYADGGDLDARIKKQKKPFSEQQILDWFVQLVLAIKHIHDRKIIHRDIKSENIFLTHHQTLIKIGDFGIARHLSSSVAQAMTRIGCFAPDTPVLLHSGEVLPAHQLQQHHLLVGCDGTPIRIVPNTLIGTQSCPMPPAPGYYYTSSHDSPSHHTTSQPSFAAHLHETQPPGTTPSGGWKQLHEINNHSNMFQNYTVSDNHVLTVATHDELSGKNMLYDYTIEEYQSLTQQQQFYAIKYDKPIQFQSSHPHWFETQINNMMLDMNLPIGCINDVHYDSPLNYRAALLTHALVNNHSHDHHHRELADILNEINYRTQSASQHSSSSQTIFPPTYEQLTALSTHEQQIECMKNYIIDTCAWMIGVWLADMSQDVSGTTISHILQHHHHFDDNHTVNPNDNCDDLDAIQQKCRHWCGLLGLSHYYTELSPNSKSQSEAQVIIQFHPLTLDSQHSILRSLLSHCQLISTTSKYSQFSSSSPSSPRLDLHQLPISTRMSLLSGVLDGNGRRCDDDIYHVISHSHDFALWLYRVFRHTGFNTNNVEFHSKTQLYHLSNIIAHYDHSSTLSLACCSKRTQHHGRRLHDPFISRFEIAPTPSKYGEHDKLHPVVSFQVESDDQRFLLGDGTIVHNTPYYLSPEICKNLPYNQKTDIWSLGVVLFELLTLRHPFDATSMEGLLKKIVKGHHGAISKQYSMDIRNLCDSLLAKDPKKRPSINEIARLPIIQAHVAKFLSPQDVQEEFSHTMIHDFKPIPLPKQAVTVKPTKKTPLIPVPKPKKSSASPEHKEYENNREMPARKQRVERERERDPERELDRDYMNDIDEDPSYTAADERERQKELQLQRLLAKQRQAYEQEQPRPGKRQIAPPQSQDRELERQKEREKERRERQRESLEFQREQRDYRERVDQVDREIANQVHSQLMSVRERERELQRERERERLREYDRDRDQQPMPVYGRDQYMARREAERQAREDELSRIRQTYYTEKKERDQKRRREGGLTKQHILSSDMEEGKEYEYNHNHDSTFYTPQRSPPSSYQSPILPASIRSPAPSSMYYGGALQHIQSHPSLPSTNSQHQPHTMVHSHSHAPLHDYRYQQQQQQQQQRSPYNYDYGHDESYLQPRPSHPHAHLHSPVHPHSTLDESSHDYDDMLDQSDEHVVAAASKQQQSQYVSPYKPPANYRTPSDRDPSQHYTPVSVKKSPAILPSLHSSPYPVGKALHPPPFAVDPSHLSYVPAPPTIQSAAAPALVVSPIKRGIASIPAKQQKKIMAPQRIWRS